MNNCCGYCGMIHQGMCPRIKCIEYHPDGATVKRVEFHAPPAVGVAPNIHPILGALSEAQTSR